MSLRPVQQPAGPQVSSAVVLDPVEMLVLIDSFDGDQPNRRASWQVENWPTSPTHQPAAGDRCLVQRDQAGRVWVIVGDWTDPIPPPEPWRPTWLTPTFQANWGSLAGVPVRHALWPDDGVVRLRGSVSRTGSAWTNYTPILTLTAGPAQQADFLCPGYAGGVAGWFFVYVSTDGRVNLGEPAPTLRWGTGLNIISLSQISFWSPS